jgi:hypothetical protein
MLGARVEDALDDVVSGSHDGVLVVVAFYAFVVGFGTVGIGAVALAKAAVVV